MTLNWPALPVPLADKPAGLLFAFWFSRTRKPLLSLALDRRRRPSFLATTAARSLADAQVVVKAFFIRRTAPRRRSAPDGAESEGRGPERPARCRQTISGLAQFIGPSYSLNSQFREPALTGISAMPSHPKFNACAHGFTLVEMMVVVAIIVILAALAVPAYTTYSLKAKFTEVVVATAPTKSAIAVCATSGDCVSGGQIYLGGGIPPTPTAHQFYELMYTQVYSSSLSASQVDAIADQWTAAGFYIAQAPGYSLSYPIYCSKIVSDPGDCQSTSLLMPTVSPPLPIPCVGSAPGCSPSTKYAQSVSYDTAGVITATAVANAGLAQETYLLTPNYSSGRVDWNASGTCLTRAGGALC